MAWEECGKSISTNTECVKRKDVQLKLQPGYWLYVDADRDGKVDGNIYVDEWTRGKGNRGAVILVNCDADGDPLKPEPVQVDGVTKMEIPWRPRRMDHESSTLHGEDDLLDLAPLVIGRTVEHVSPAWQGILSITDSHERIRIFLKTESKTGKGQKTGYRQVLGKGVGSRYVLPDLKFRKLELLMAATEFPSARFGGLIPIDLTITENGGKIFGHEIVVKVAPWMMYHHLNPTKKVFSVDLVRNRRFLTDLDRELSKAGIGPSQKFDHAENSDRWAQDVMEIGYTHLPKTSELPVILRTPSKRDSSLQDWAQNGLLGPGMGFVEAISPIRKKTRDSLGNIECSPPVKAQGKDYKFGRIIYGNSVNEGISPRLIQFLNAQRVQHPFSIDTSWLSVGHVDEVISFCPMQDTPKKFRVLIASPRLAMELVEKLVRNRVDSEFAQLPDSELKKMSELNAKKYAFYRGYSAKTICRSDELRDVQSNTQKLIDKICINLQNELGLSSDDFIELPVLFCEGGFRGEHEAFTPNVINNLVLTRANGSAHLIIPKPFAPSMLGRCVFEREIDERLGKFKGSGLTYGYVDNFIDCHINSGGIHCATNSQRQASFEEFWWEQEHVS